MARDFNGTTQYGHQDTSPLTAYPATMACWINADVVNAVQVFFQGVGVSGSDQTLALYIDASAHLNAFANDGSGSSATGTAAVSASTWTHACGVFASATSRSVYTNGADKQSNTTSRNFPASSNRIAVGAQYAAAGVPTNPFNGRVAEAGLWSVALDDAEVAALAKGFSPMLIRPTALVGYWMLLGNLSPEQDSWRSKLDFTLVNSPAKADHLRIYYPNGVF